jgi:hypothetical protein
MVVVVFAIHPMPFPFKSAHILCRTMTHDIIMARERASAFFLSSIHPIQISQTKPIIIAFRISSRCHEIQFFGYDHVYVTVTL